MMHEKLTVMLNGKKATGETFEIVSSPESPYIHLRLKRKFEDRDEAELLLEKVVDLCFQKEVLIAKAAYSTREFFIPAPGLKLNVPLQITKEEIDQVVDTLKAAITEVFVTSP